MTQIANTEQAEYWSGPSGETWVTKQTFFDALLAPVLELLLEHTKPKTGQHILDLGCGTGTSLLALAGRVGVNGQVTGVDVSTPMLRMAKSRVDAAGVTHVNCIEADAQIFDFDTMNVDQVVSRFGVMFFENPFVAFRNIAKALKPGGKISFVTWAGMQDNPWFRMPIEQAKARVGAPPPPDPRAPGPMAFSEQGYVTDVLAQAGLIDIAAYTSDLLLTPKGSRADVAEFAGREGPASRILREMGGTDEDAKAVMAGLYDAFSGFETPDGIRVPAKLNMFTACATD